MRWKSWPGVLDGGNSARLETNLVRGQEVTASVSVSYDLASRAAWPVYHPGRAGTRQDNRRVEQAVREQFENLKEEEVGEQEMSRVKAQVVSSDVYERDSLFYQAMALGIFETVGLPWRLADEYVQRIQAVTAEQVKRVANKYFGDDGLTIAVLDPQPIERKQVQKDSNHHAL